MNEKDWQEACRKIGGDTIPKGYEELVCKTKGGELSLVNSEVEFRGGEVAGRIEDIEDVHTRETESGETVMVVSNEDGGVELGEEQTILRM